MPGGGVRVAEEMPYHHLVNELRREVKRETGIELEFDDLMPPMYLVFFGKAKDLALVVTTAESFSGQLKGEIKWASFKELNQLAKDYKPADKEKGEDGQGIVSGWGKRMHCMALQTFYVHGSSEDCIEASDTLDEIQKSR